jgi:hypothetical protein
LSLFHDVIRLRALTEFSFRAISDARGILSATRCGTGEAGACLFNAKRFAGAKRS